jgi:hypothetical protein
MIRVPTFYTYHVLTPVKGGMATFLSLTEIGKTVMIESLLIRKEVL